MSPPAATRRTTRSMAASASIVLTKRRRASAEVNAGLPHSALSVPPSSSFFTPSSTKSQRTSAPVKLEELPTELGHLIIEHLTVEAMANLTLCSKTTAAWVSSSLLRKVTRCEYDSDAEPLAEPDGVPCKDPDHVMHFISAVTSVCIPPREKARFVAGIIHLHCRTFEKPPKETLATECSVLRGILSSWSAQRQGEMLSVFLATELANLKKISHFDMLPTDPASESHAEDARIFNLLNYVTCLPVACGGNGTETAAADKGKTAVTGGVGGNGSRCPSCGVSDATASSMWRHLAEVTSILMAGKDPEVAATLIHLMLGPNTFYMSLKVQGAQPDPEPDEDFWALFDLNEETALDYAEEMNYKDIANHWESFDTNLCLFTAFLSQMLPTLSHELGSKTLESIVFAALTIGLVTVNWSFQFKLALVAGLVRRDPAAHVHLLSSPVLSDHVSPQSAANSSGLGAALFRILARNTWTVEDFVRFYGILSEDWSDDTQRSVLGDVLGTHLEALLIMRGCSCGCVEPSLNPEVLGKLTALAKMGLTMAGASSRRKKVAADAAAAAVAAEEEEEEEGEGTRCMSCDDDDDEEEEEDEGEMSSGDGGSFWGEAGSTMPTPGPAVSRYFEAEE